MMDEIWLDFNSVENLIDEEIWNSFIPNLELCLGEKLTHLDIHDPIRKKVSCNSKVGDYICAFGEQESSRQLFGKFGRSKVEIGISLSKEDAYPLNSVTVYLPTKMLENKDGIKIILNIFKLGNRSLKPFYSFGDHINQISGKKKATGMAVSLEVELLGMFWLTYLNKTYVNFFGQNKIEQLSKLDTDSSISGVELMLGALPASLESISLRKEAEKLLGQESFVDPSSCFDKQEGKQALTFGQLSRTKGVK